MLQDVLTRHPRCSPHLDPEDFLISGLEWLDQYAEAVHQRRRSKQFREDLRDDIRLRLGQALAAQIVHNSDKNQSDRSYVIAKTPSVEGLSRLRKFFPDAPVVLLVRDGRAVVESAMRSFGADFESGCRRFAVAANTLDAFMQNDPNPDRTFLIRFEDYLENKTETISALLEFLELDSGGYPFDDLDEMPVRGSSELKAQGEGSIHWSPVAADDSFDPRDRFSDWPADRHARFNWIAGAELERLGYQRSGSNSRLYSFRNTLRDMWYKANPGRLWRKIGVRLRRKHAG